MADIKQIEQEYSQKRLEIERDHRIKLQELTDGSLDNILYGGKSKDKIAQFLKQDYEDDLDQLAYDAKRAGEIEYHPIPSPSHTG